MDSQAVDPPASWTRPLVLNERLKRLHWVLAALAYLLFAVLITYPVALHLTTRMAGESTGDTLEFVWSTWWWKHALLDLRQNPIHIGVLNHPSGLEFPLLPVMSQSFLLALPIAALASPVFAYNFVFLTSFVGCGLAGYALCAELSGDKRAGFLGGLIWAFFPNKMGHALAGHLFQLVVFAFPLLALTWLRLLKSPSTRNAVWAALALVLSSTVHPVYLAYFVAPLVTLLVGHTLWVERRGFWRTEKRSPTASSRLETPARMRASSTLNIGSEKTRALAIALGLAALLIGPLLAPAIAQALKGGLTFLAERGAVGFAFDGLAYFLPPPENPLVLRTPLASLAGKVVLTRYESIAYLGWLPLLLAVIGARARWPESRVWVLLGLISGILALGPLLKIGGGLVRAPVEDGSYPVVMPYSLIGNLPFFQWSRTPGRFDVLVMLALSVLAAFGFAYLIRFSVLRFVPRFLVLSIASLLITAEYLVKFPFPTLPAVVPEPLENLREDRAGLAVLNLPVPDNSANLRSLYWQTIHQHPLVGGRVYREIPGAQVLHDFLSRLLLSPDGADIVPSLTDQQRRAVLAASGVGWVLYDAQADPQGLARSQLETRLGPPGREADGVALFAPVRAELHPGALLWVLASNWYPAQDWGGQPGRWLRGRGLVYVFAGSEGTGRLAFTAIPGQDLHRLTVLVNGRSAGRFAVGDWTEYHTEPLKLQAGLNLVEFVDEDGTRSYVGDPRCAGGSPVSGPYPVPVSCDSADRTARDLSLVVSNLRLVPENAILPIRTSGALFGDSVQLVGYSLQAGAELGEAIHLHLVWRVTAASAEDFTVLAHLLDEDGALVTGADAWPVGGAYPTSRWGAGEVVAYNLTLALPASAAPGTYTVQIGLYRWPSLERLPISGAENVKDNVLQLGTLIVGR